MLRILCPLALLCFSVVGANVIRTELELPTHTVGQWRLSNAFVEVPQGANAPFVQQISSLEISGPTKSGSAFVSFEINEKGIPFNIQVDKPSNKDLEAEVIAMIREWRFEAATKNGMPIVSRGELDLLLDTRIIQPPMRRLPTRPKM